MFGVNIYGKNNLYLISIPTKLCKVILGQLYKWKVPEYLTMKVTEFVIIKPQDQFRKFSQSVCFPFCFSMISSSYKLEYPSRSKLTIARNSLWNPNAN